ncbi:class I SAM-dependent methyltransferase [Streptomyces sp. NBC_00259]|uniref:class I SAM-dependent methyltransferase n=1 Tax=Streptomyces sp. NBC_00259 TaxID=2903643 RepID=UPI002E293630|nr:class I SAM-dependent methyltransferase [Streptomyces sp. NBC_00259]
MTDAAEQFDPRDPSVRQMMRTNEANWDARTPVHLASRFYGVDGARGDTDPDRWFAAFEWDDLGDLTQRDVLHLQCHLGTETLAFARRGARTTGLDISGASVTAARNLAAEAGLDVDYVRANVYDAAEALGEERRFDLIYTGKGALCYLPDLDRWAATVAGLLRPGGRLYLVEFHPLLNSLGPKPAPGEGPELLLRHDYLGGRGAVRRDSTYTYTDGPAVRGATESFEWMHGLDEVINALTGAGLGITRLRESDELPWPRWPHMVRTPGGWWRLPDGAPRIPLLYALLARL